MFVLDVILAVVTFMGFIGSLVWFGFVIKDARRY